MENREQKLIDAMFEIAQASYLMNRGPKKTTEYYNDVREDHMIWVANQLRSLGFDTAQVGASWGMLLE